MTTCLEWVNAYDKASNEFKTNQVYSDKHASYVRNYVIRAWLLAGMHRHGVRRLGGQGEIGVAKFARAFPDSKKWVQVLQRPGSARSLAAFLADLQYDGPPELLTMHLCLLLTREMWKTASWYAANRTPLQSLMLEGSGCTDLHMLPALCVARHTANARDA